MLPENVDTERGRYLQNLIKNASRSEWADWPMLKQSDFVLVGQIVVLFSYIDLNLRRIAEVADHAGMLQRPWKEKTARLTIDDTENAVRSLDWSDANRGVLEKISKFRGLRNMLAHFVLRRFPKEDAFVCLAISERDYEKQLGVKPERGALLSAVLDYEQVKEAVKHVEHVQVWLAKVTSEVELKFGSAPGGT
jgi:hypothetical protein